VLPDGETADRLGSRQRAARSRAERYTMPDYDLTPLVFVGALLLPGLIAHILKRGCDNE
jgi:hypothetical protein